MDELDVLQKIPHWMITTRHIDDSGEDDPSEEQLSSLYDELKNSHQEHGDVSVTDEETGWCISAHRDGRVVLGNLLGDGVNDRHMHPVSKQKVMQLWVALTRGQMQEVEAEPWLPGYQ